MQLRMLTLALAMFGLSLTSPAQTSSPSLASHPINFEVNQGQTDPQVRYLAHMNRSSIFFTPQEAVLSLDGSKGASGVLRIGWESANAAPSVSAEEPLPGKVNYLVGKDRSKWHTDVPTFAKVRYRGIYHGVDAVFYGRQGELEYDVMLAPGADLQKVRFTFEGAKQVSDAKNGDRVLKLEPGEVRQH